MDAKVLQDARSFLRSFRSVIAFADAIDQAGTLESDMAAGRKAYEDLLKSVANAKSELEVLRAESSGLQKEADAIKGEARAEAKRLKDQATVAANTKTKNAEDVCRTLVENAKNAASSMDQRAAHAAKEVEAKKAELAEVENQLASVTKALQDLKAKL